MSKSQNMPGKRLIVNEVIMHDLSKLKLYFRGTVPFKCKVEVRFRCVH